MFEFSDDEQFLAQNPAGAARDLQDARRRSSPGAARRDDAAARQDAERALSAPPAAVPPTVRFDNEHSQKYTVLEIVADDAIGLLHRISADDVASRMRSRPRADLDEGKKAIDVLHVSKRENKLSDADQAALGQELEGMLEGANEAD